MHLREKLFLKALHHIFPFGLKVQSGISGAKGTWPHEQTPQLPHLHTGGVSSQQSPTTPGSQALGLTQSMGPNPASSCCPKICSPLLCSSLPRGVFPDTSHTRSYEKASIRPTFFQIQHPCSLWMQVRLGTELGLGLVSWGILVGLWGAGQALPQQISPETDQGIYPSLPFYPVAVFPTEVSNMPSRQEQ